MKIELSNIKKYEETTEQVRKLWKEEKKANIFLRILLFLTNQMSMLPKEIEKSKIISYDVLVISTKQSEEYRFSEYDSDINVKDIIKKLDKYFELS